MHLTFRSQKRDKQLAPSGHQVLLEPFSSLVFKYAILRMRLGDIYLWCEGRFLEIDPHPTVATPSAPGAPPSPPPAALTYAPSIKLKLATLNRA